MRLVLLCSVDVYVHEDNQTTQIEPPDLHNTMVRVHGYPAILVDTEPDATTHQLMGTKPE